MTIEVRKAEKSDAPKLLALVNALAEYEKLDPPTEEAQSRLIADGWPEAGPPRFEAWLAESSTSDASQATPIGYAITFYTYSSFLARPTLYIEDIFVLPNSRRRGAGTALFNSLTSEAERKGCGRIEWVVLDWNTLAQEFYQKRGASHLQDWQYYRLTLPS